MINLNEIIERIKNTFNIEKDKDIAELLEVSHQVFGNWKSREKIPYEEIISLCLKKDIDLKFILNGTIDEGKIKTINYKEEIHKMIDDVKEEKAEIYYHLIKAELLKEKL